MAKRKHRRLVQGNLERISSKVFDIYHDEITQLVGRQHGVYALYKKNRLYYVGLAKNLLERFSKARKKVKERNEKKRQRELFPVEADNAEERFFSTKGAIPSAQVMDQSNKLGSKEQ